MSEPHYPKQNLLLAALPEESYARLHKGLELIAMPLGWALSESGDALKNAYFPTSSIISLLYVTIDGDSSETAVAGYEGMVGVSLFLGSGGSTNRAIVQSAGHGYRLNREHAQREFALGGAFQELMLRYTQSLMTQMGQTSVCNRHHSVDQQLCRWLLLSIDRISGDELIMTQDLIANMLGVRREGVTEAAGKLQKAGLIRYRRGKITMLDRSAMETRVCECYAVVKREFERLMGPALRAATTSV